MVILVGYILLWVLLAVGLGGILSYYVQAEIFCAQRETELTPGLVAGAAAAACFSYVDTGEK